MRGGFGESNMRGRPFGGPGPAGMGASVTEDMMHQDNDDSLSRLSDRVRGLKEVNCCRNALSTIQARAAQPAVAER